MIIRVLLFACTALALLSCDPCIGLFRGPACFVDEPPTPPPPPPTPNQVGCRTYASSYTDNQNGWTTTCSFSTSQATLTCDDDTTEQTHQVKTYAQSADFILEVETLGLWLVQTIDTTTNSGGSLTQTNVTDPMTGRSMASVTIDNNTGSVTQTFEFTQWDASNRPVAGTRSLPGVCSDMETAFLYQANHYEMEEAFGVGPGCFTPTWYQWVFDADRIQTSYSYSMEVAGTPVSGTIDYTINATETVCL